MAHAHMVGASVHSERSAFVRPIGIARRQLQFEKQFDPYVLDEWSVKKPSDWLHSGWLVAGYNNTIPIPIVIVVIRSQFYIDEDLLPDWLSFSHVIVHIVLGFPLYPSLQNRNSDNKYGTGLLFTIANVMCDTSHTNILETSDSLAFE